MAATGKKRKRAAVAEPEAADVPTPTKKARKGMSSNSQKNDSLSNCTTCIGKSEVDGETSKASAEVGAGGPVEIVFSFDTTGSMYPCLTQVGCYNS